MIQLHCVPPRAVTPQVLLERAVNLPLEDVEVGSACLPACLPDLPAPSPFTECLRLCCHNQAGGCRIAPSMPGPCKPGLPTACLPACRAARS